MINTNHVDEYIYSYIYIFHTCVHFYLEKHLHIQEETALDLIGTNSNKQNNEQL